MKLGTPGTPNGAAGITAAGATGAKGLAPIGAALMDAPNILDTSAVAP